MRQNEECDGISLTDSIQDGIVNLWMGLHRDGANGSFTQWEDGSALEYSNWYPGEPNNDLGNEPRGEVSNVKALFKYKLAW